MNNINSNGKVGKINFNIKKENKLNKKQLSSVATRQVEASSLDALNSYGKAGISFKGGVPNQNKVPSSEEVLEKLETVGVADFIVDSLAFFIFRLEVEEVNQFYDFIASEPKLYKNNNVINNLVSLAISIDLKEENRNLETKFGLLQEYVSNPKWNENEDIEKNIGEIIVEADKDIDYLKRLIDKVVNKDLSINKLIAYINAFGVLDEKEINKLADTLPEEMFDEISTSKSELVFFFNHLGLYDKKNVSEFSFKEKRELAKSFVSQGPFSSISELGQQYFPLVPKNSTEYDEFLFELVNSLGFQTNVVSVEQEKDFHNSVSELAINLAKLSDEEFNNLSITQEYSKDDFIKDALSVVQDLPKNEKQKIYDYFAFELQENQNAPMGFSIVGYPRDLNDYDKLIQIEKSETIDALDKLRPFVIKFAQENKTICENKDVETLLNNIMEVLPEMRTTIGKEQYGMHEFDVLKHSLKLMQKTAQNPHFEQLNDSDKKILLLSALLHDITKAEVNPDPDHNVDSSFDAFFITKKFNLTQDEQNKLYTLIRHHEWLKHLNDRSVPLEEVALRLESVAYDFRNDNLFEMAKIFTEADIKAIMKDNSLYDKFLPVFDGFSKLIDDKIDKLKETQPLLPTTKLPKASEIEARISEVYEDCSTNLKGVYLKDGLVVIKYNEVEDWEALGLPKGSASRGVKLQNPIEDELIDTGNIKFIAHGLDNSSHLTNFYDFVLPDSNALLSVSYMERPESKYCLFYEKGVLLDVDSKYIHGGGKTNSGSGCGKNIDEFKINYAYEGRVRYEDRKYISDLIKRTLNLSNEEYIDFVNENQNKSMLEIEPKEVRDALIKEFALINSNLIDGNRDYNEMYVTNPKVQGVFVTPSIIDKSDEISKFIEKQVSYLKNYARKNDLPFIVFGD